MNVHVFKHIDSSILKQALKWSAQFDNVCLFQSNGYEDDYSNLDWLLAVDKSDEFIPDGDNTFNKIERFKTGYPNRWIPGFFSYELKNEIEDLITSFDDQLQFPEAYFFIPRTVFSFQEGQLKIQSEEDPHIIFEQILSWEVPTQKEQLFNGTFHRRMSKEAYTQAFEHLKNHIIRGDIYEVNLCQEFYAEECIVDPYKIYERLVEISPTPFATFFKLQDKYILSASPERFLAKRGNTLISQPIKGTAPRGSTAEEDEQIKSRLHSDPKEIAENVMIVDLVRNDLTRSAKPGSVAAERQLEIHTFKQVHQLISTITCQKNKKISDLDCIRHTFPPGSMTGAPKINAMALCNRYERSKRGIYSGAVGYFAPDGNFDFNVVIRTLLYNHTNRYLSFHTGGAITFDAQAEDEYRECLLKAKAILETLGTTLHE